MQKNFPERLYIDSSVLIAYNDENEMHRTNTHKLWRLMDKGLVRLMTSEVAEDEASRGHEKTRKLFKATFSDVEMILPITKDAIKLADLYISAGVLTRNHEDDALHVAVCTLSGLRWLLSWNFHHVKPERSAKFNRVNHLNGLPFVHIVTPYEYLIQL